MEKCEMKMFMLYNFFSILCLSICVSSKELPIFLRNLRCPRTQMDGKCFDVNANKAIPIIAQGDPEYGIPNMIPLKFPFMNIISTPSMSLNFTNVEVHGLDKMKLISHKIDPVKQLYILNLKSDNITVVGNYEADGKILLMPLKGKGRFKLYFKNGRYRTASSVIMIEKDGEKYFKPTEIRFQARFAQLILRFDDLFEGNEVLGEQVNNFLNENWETVLADFGPSVEKTVEKIIKDIFENLSSGVPAKDMFV